MKSKRKILPLLLTVVMIIGLLPATTALADAVGDFDVIGGVLGVDFTYSDGVLTFVNPGDYTVSMLTPGATTGDRIYVNSTSGTKITLNGVNIDVSAISGACAFDIDIVSTVEIAVSGSASSVLKSGAGKPGIRVVSNVSLTLTGDRTLRVYGGLSGAGIGGGTGENSGVININTSGIIETHGGGNGAGIGGGDGGSNGTVRIYNGDVRAYDGAYGAGIGGGNGGNGGNIYISGGTVLAQSVACGAGIGGGSGGSGTMVDITGGTINALGGPGGTGQGGGAGIGGGASGGASGNIYISDGTVTASGNGDPDGNGGAGIGGGYYGNAQNITIAGGTVTAIGGQNASGLGGGRWGAESDIYIAPVAGTFLDVCAGAAAPGYRLPGSPFSASTSYEDESEYFHSEAYTPGFTVTGGAIGTDYTYNYNSGILTITSGTEMTVSMTSPGTTTNDTIAITSDIDANITFSGVSIDASGASGACALKIADGSSGNVNITLSGNNVLKSGNNCAGLQKNGSDTGIGTLTISGSGALTAEGGSGGAGIGGGSGGSTRNIVISGGTVTAAGTSGGAGVGGGSGGSGSNISTAPAADCRIRVYAGSSAATATELAGSPFTSQTSYAGTYAYFRSVMEAAPGLYVTGGTEGTDYTYTDGLLTIINDTAMTISMANPGATTHDTITVAGGVNANITFSSVSIDVSDTPNACALLIADGSTGDVHITLTGDCKFKSGQYCAGLQKSGSGAGIGTLTIGGTGSLTATGGSDGAGIGGGYFRNASNIIINGGTVIATGGYMGAGIGGGNGWAFGGGDASNITISGGTVTAQGGNSAAGIGGGNHGDASNIAISSGTVTAQGGLGAAGIGGGYLGSASDIAISGGRVTADGSAHSAGIGGGCGMDADNPGGGCSNITISGGEVIATGGEYGPGIGSGGIFGGPSGSAGINVNIAPAPGVGISVFFGDTTPPTGTPASGNPIVAPNIYAYTGTYRYFHSERQVERVALISATADGVSGTQTSTKIDLVFDSAITGLRTEDIIITNGTGSAVKGTLTGSGSNWSIALTSVAAEGTVSVAISAPDGYSITGSPKTVEVYKTVPTINPVNGIFDKNPANQADVQTIITWHDATSVTDVKAGGVSIGGGSYSISGNTLTIKKEYLASQPVGNLVLSVEFNTGGTATLTIEISDTTPITGLPATYTMYEGGRVTWNPKPDGGTWDWDEDFFSATFNSPATFTALKAGTSVITYTVDGVSQSIEVTVRQAALPNTGQDDTWIWALVSLATLCGAGAVFIGRKKKVNAQK